MTLFTLPFSFVRSLGIHRQLLLLLTKNSFRKQYLGSYLGIFWVFIQPLAFISVIWFVFEKGLRVGPSVADIPFFLWLICGIVPWFFFLNALTSATDAIINNAHYVKKMAIPNSMLPLVNISCSLLIHLCLLPILLTALLLYGYRPNLYWLQIPLILCLSGLLLLGLGWLTSSLRVFIKDIGNLVSLLLQIGFWATPIFWSPTILPEWARQLLLLNPAYFLVNGFRQALLLEQWIWETPDLLIIFVTQCCFFLACGGLVFKKLKTHFGDVL